MNKNALSLRKALTITIISLCLLLTGLVLSVDAVTVNVVDGAGTPVAGEFRWQLEEDNTVRTAPGVLVNDSIGLVIHKSHAPVVGNGSGVNGMNVPIPDATKNYFLSVMAEGYSLGAASVTTQTTVTVILNRHKIPTAQITFIAFVDHDRINNALDETDTRLGGCRVIPSDVLGPVEFDVFGNPLGTRYQRDPTTGDFLEDADGNPMIEVMGSGIVRTLTQREFDLGLNPDNLKVGEAVIKNLPPGKYGTIAIPPDVDDNGVPVKWVQTTTIEGTPTIDAWVAADEPAYFVEGFGTGFKHVAQGFVKLSPITPSVIHGSTIDALPWTAAWPTGGTATVRGRLRYNHFSKPPNNQGFFPGGIVPEGWIGLNDPTAIPEVTPGGLFAMPCDDNGVFVITNLPAGQYQLVSWDKPLDNLFGVHAVNPANQATFAVTNGANIDLGDLLIFRWFASLEGHVFYDMDEDGFQDPIEPGIPLQAVNLRFRNGVMYQATVTDLEGQYQLSEVFPFFKWLVAEVDFARFKATGLTKVVDDGGEVLPDAGWDMPTDGVRRPQPQYAVDPVTGVALTNQPINNPNTGNNLSGTETGPILTQAAHLFLNQFCRIDWGKIDYPQGENGGISGIAFYSTTRAEEDPREAAGDAWEPGIPRVQVVLYGDVDLNKVIDDLDGDGGVTLADVDNYPLGWWDDPAQKGSEDVDHDGNGTFDTGDAIQIVWSDSWDDVAEENPTLGAIQVNPPVILGKAIVGCDNYSTWNQIRPEVFDGGYAFNGIPAGMYIVQTCPPKGYLIQTEESLNVVFGDAFTPSKLALLPECVGTATNHGGAAGNAYASSIVPVTRTDPYTVPAFLSLFPAANEPAAFAGEVRPLADMKWVQVLDGRNAAADFHLYTEVPKAGRGVGFVLNDLGAEFNQAGPNFGEKLAAPWIPISIRDWAGHEIDRIYADEFGTYNFLVPSTYSVNVPTPSGVSENMLTIVLNDPLLPDGTTDPNYNPMYATAPWTFNYSAGGLSYLDTPIVPLTAFTTSEKRVDTEPQENEPVIKEVNGPEPLGGPWIRTTGGASRQVTIAAMGPTSVVNPNYNPAAPGEPNYIVRNYGFGATPGSVTLSGNALAIVSWSDSQIVVAVSNNAPTGDLLVKRGDNGLSTQIGVTLHSVNPAQTGIHHVPADFASIQAAIDSPNCQAGDLVLVAPGVYNENVIMNKPVRLQGYGAGSTIVYGNPTPLQRLQEWHQRVDALGARELAAHLLKDPFQANEAPVVLICGELVYPAGTVQIPLEGTKTFNPGNPFKIPGQAQLDGFSLLGSKAGGGVFVVCGAPDVKISNNNIYGNQGGDAGAITIGTEDVGFDSGNYRNLIHRNRCHRNSGIAGAGAISINEASDNYIVEDNLMIGNFTRANGAGFGHRGLCGGTNIVRRNSIVFNENLYQALFFAQGNGGGMYIGGDVAGGNGAGHVVIEENLIQGNMTGAGKGGGICVFAMNGQDVIQAPTDPNSWYRLQIVNNVIVNNLAAFSGGGITVEDSVRVTIAHNTIANNDCTATSALLFNPGTQSPPQGAGIVAYSLSATLAAAMELNFVSPAIVNNIIWHNRSFFFDPALNNNAGGLAPNPAGLFQDLAAVGAAGPLNVTFCLLTSTAGFPGSNIAGNPQFLQPYTNVIETATVIDEGGNNVNLRFLPIHATGDYHVASSSPAANAATANPAVGFTQPATDFDGQFRPAGSASDIGADEAYLTLVVARNNFYNVNEDTTLGFSTARNVLSNDSSPGGALQAVLVEGPKHAASFTLRADGQFSYRGAASFIGTDTFRYRARVGASYSLAAEVSITVNSVNDRPIAVGDGYAVNGNVPLTIPAPGVLANDTDADGDLLTASLVGGPFPDQGTLAFNADGSFTFTPNAGYEGPVLYIYSANDGQQSSLIPGLLLFMVAAPQPDFVISSLAIAPQPVRTGDPMTVQVTVQNQGSIPGDAGLLTIWRDLGGPEVPAGTVGDASVNVGVMNAGAVTTVVFNLTAPPLPAPVENQQPPVIFRAFINSASAQQAEFSTANNQTTTIYRVVTYGPAFSGLPVDNDGVDTDGDGNPNNDFVYAHLAGGDGFAKMADGNELYTFSFADYTVLTLTMMNTHPDLILNTIMREGMLKAEISAPTIALKEGQRFYLDLSNVGMIMRPDLFDPHTIHFHGFPQAASIFDGEPFASIAINPGATLRYYYQINDPGTYLYHCHMEATEHMEMGMLGSIYVLPKQNYLAAGTSLARLPAGKGTTHQAGYKYAYNDGDGSTYYDIDYALQIGGFDRFFHEQHIAVQPLPFATLDESYPMINGRGYPDTINTGLVRNVSVQERFGLPEPYPSQKLNALVKATQGQYVLLRISNVSLSDFHTISVLGIPMRVIAKDAALLRGPAGADLSYETTSFTFGGGETVDLLLDTRNVAPGAYFLYDARLNHLCNDEEDFGGMMTEIVISAPVP
ncbi:MAG TPA: hypothetical protein DCZ95_17770 [Verrucomicrobia bacterium]|nr:MAG: hypothetical protein A2X46_07450 [Lentisphaerae bacterium GWF2_57_35]HBA85935.1 hypothetical protein [Verrucomicrobiota bacterium]